MGLEWGKLSWLNCKNDLPPSLNLLVLLPKFWVTIWQKGWKWRLLFVIMTFLTNSQVRSKNTLKNSRKKCLKKQKKAVWIYAIYHWLQLMAKMRAILMMPYIAKKAVKAGSFGWQLPMSAIMCVYVLHWTQKLITEVTPFTSLIVLCQCCRRFYPTDYVH